MSSPSEVDSEDKVEEFSILSIHATAFTEPDWLE